MSNNAPYFAEIVGGISSLWEIQPWEWDKFPPIGTIVVAEEQSSKIYGIISSIETTSLDQTHKPHAFGKTNEELLRDYPHIFAFLQTTIKCHTIAYYKNEKLLYLHAPNPPKLHSFVRSAFSEESEPITTQGTFLYPLLTGLASPDQLDEIILAFLQNYQSPFASKNVILFSNIIRHLSFLLQNDLPRLRCLTKRIEQSLL